MLLCNSRSILPKIDEARATCAALRPDIFICTETWLNPAHSDNLLSIANYSVIRQDRANRTGGGVAAWCSKSISFDRLQTPLTTPKSVECLWLFLHPIKILLLCIYIPPSVIAADLKEIETYITDSCDYFSTKLYKHNIVL